MFGRPGAQDTEKDLLRFQDEFLAGRLNPSATVVRANKEDETGPCCAGDKRVLPEVERDVVDLNGEGFTGVLIWKLSSSLVFKWEWE